MCGNPRESDEYAPTPFQEANAILLAGMWVDDDDDEAYTKLEDLLREMSPGELDRLANAARFLANTCPDRAASARRSAARLAHQAATGGGDD